MPVGSVDVNKKRIRITACFYVVLNRGLHAREKQRHSSIPANRFKTSRCQVSVTQLDNSLHIEARGFRAGQVVLLDGILEGKVDGGPVASDAQLQLARHFGHGPRHTVGKGWVYRRGRARLRHSLLRPTLNPTGLWARPLYGAQNDP